MPGEHSREQAHGRARIPRVESAEGRLQPPEAAASHASRRSVSGDLDAESLEAGPRRAHVGAGRQTSDDGLAFGESAEDQGSMRHGLVARHAHLSLEAAASGDDAVAHPRPFSAGVAMSRPSAPAIAARSRMSTANSSGCSA